MSATKYALLCFVLAIGCYCASYSVTGNVKNEIPNDLNLKDSKLTSGTFTKKPAQTLKGGSSAYVNSIWVAEGEDGVEGYVEYESANKFGTATFYFSNTASKSNYTAFVNPSPFIGGVDNSTGTTEVYVDYWTHQMCVPGLTANCLKIQ